MTKYRQLCNGFELFCRFQLLNVVLFSFWSTIIQIWIKFENLKIQDGGHLWRHSYNSGCHGNQLNTTWFRLIENTKEGYYMYQVSCQSDELCRKYTVFFFEASRVIFDQNGACLPNLGILNPDVQKIVKSDFPLCALEVSVIHVDRINTDPIWSICATRRSLPGHVFPYTGLSELLLHCSKQKHSIMCILWFLS